MSCFLTGGSWYVPVFRYAYPAVPAAFLEDAFLFAGCWIGWRVGVGIGAATEIKYLKVLLQCYKFHPSFMGAQWTDLSSLPVKLP